MGDKAGPVGMMGRGVARLTAAMLGSLCVGAGAMGENPAAWEGEQGRDRGVAGTEEITWTPHGTAMETDGAGKEYGICAGSEMLTGTESCIWAGASTGILVGSTATGTEASKFVGHVGGSPCCCDAACSALFSHPGNSSSLSPGLKVSILPQVTPHSGVGSPASVKKRPPPFVSITSSMFFRDSGRASARMSLAVTLNWPIRSRMDSQRAENVGSPDKEARCWRNTLDSIIAALNFVSSIPVVTTAAWWPSWLRPI